MACTKECATAIEAANNARRDWENSYIELKKKYDSLVEYVKQLPHDVGVIHSNYCNRCHIDRILDGKPAPYGNPISKLIEDDILARS